LKCKVCSREAAEGDFCLLHSKAYYNIVETYDCWQKALKISWKEYLSEIKRNPLTGEWAKEVTNYLISNEGTKNVKES
jgi:hypothetical protein